MIQNTQLKQFKNSSATMATEMIRHNWNAAKWNHREIKMDMIIEEKWLRTYIFTCVYECMQI